MNMKRMKKYSFLLLSAFLLTFYGGKALAASEEQEPCTLSSASFTIAPGDSYVMYVELRNSVAVTGVQTDVYLPDGLRLTSIGLAGRTTEEAHGTLQCVLQPDGAWRVLCASVSNALISGQSGNLLQLTVEADDAATIGLYAMTFRNTMCSAPDGSIYEPSEQRVPISISGVTGLRGDVNRDSVVDISDVTALVGFVFGNKVTIDVEMADINCDSSIDVSDVTNLVSIISSKK